MENIQSQQQQDGFCANISNYLKLNILPADAKQSAETITGPGLWELQMIYSITFGLASQIKGNQNVLNN